MTSSTEPSETIQNTSTVDTPTDVVEKNQSMELMKKHQHLKIKPVNENDQQKKE
jgi:hypothetical protein